MVNRSFLGKTIGGGVSNAMDARLGDVESDLNGQYATAVGGGFAGSIAEWAGVRTVGGARPGSGHHTAGDAIDVNYETCPYIATRTLMGSKVTLGGEAPPAGADMRFARLLATTVYDRAVAFFADASTVANVSARAGDEASIDAYWRFKNVSNALSGYLQLAFPITLRATGNPPRVNRAPVPNAHLESLATLLEAIPEPERRSEADARAQIAVALGDNDFALNHPDWDLSEDFWLQQILRDYEVVRVPMLFGNPSVLPSVTRNPANGFLDLPSEIVVALTGDPPGQTMRWGVCDFGAEASGDVQHFDLADRIIQVQGSSPPEVRIDLSTVSGIQQALGALGFDAGTVDNGMGAATQAGIDAIRAASGLVPGGIDDALRSLVTAALKAAAVPF